MTGTGGPTEEGGFGLPVHDVIEVEYVDVLALAEGVVEALSQPFRRCQLLEYCRSRHQLIAPVLGFDDVL